jgi:large subunit ribosomal protein L29
MAKKETKTNYNDMSKEDLTKGLISEKMKYHRMQFNHAVSPMANPIELRFVRRNIARMFTALSGK